MCSKHRRASYVNEFTEGIAHSTPLANVAKKGIQIWMSNGTRKAKKPDPRRRIPVASPSPCERIRSTELQGFPHTHPCLVSECRIVFLVVESTRRVNVDESEVPTLSLPRLHR